MPVPSGYLRLSSQTLISPSLSGGTTHWFGHHSGRWASALRSLTHAVEYHTQSGSSRSCQIIRVHSNIDTFLSLLTRFLDIFEFPETYLLGGGVGRSVRTVSKHLQLTQCSNQPLVFGLRRTRHGEVCWQGFQDTGLPAFRRPGLVSPLYVYAL